MAGERCFSSGRIGWLGPRQALVSLHGDNKGVPTIMENQMEKKMENEMETGIYRGL